MIRPRSSARRQRSSQLRHPRARSLQGDRTELCSTAAAQERQPEDRRSAFAASPQRKRSRRRSSETPPSFRRLRASDHSVPCSPTCAQRTAFSAKDPPNAATECSQGYSRALHHLPNALGSRRCEPRRRNTQIGSLRCGRLPFDSRPGRPFSGAVPLALFGGVVAQTINADSKLCKAADAALPSKTSESRKEGLLVAFVRA
jgi:hypothetical protein